MRLFMLKPGYAARIAYVIEAEIDVLDRMNPEDRAIFIDHDRSEGIVVLAELPADAELPVFPEIPR